MKRETVNGEDARIGSAPAERRVAELWLPSLLLLLPISTPASNKGRRSTSSSGVLCTRTRVVIYMRPGGCLRETRTRGRCLLFRTKREFLVCAKVPTLLQTASAIDE